MTLLPLWLADTFCKIMITNGTQHLQIVESSKIPLLPCPYQEGTYASDVNTYKWRSIINTILNGYGFLLMIRCTQVNYIYKHYY